MKAKDRLEQAPMPVGSTALGGKVVSIFIDTLEPENWRLVNLANGEIWRTLGKRRKLVRTTDITVNRAGQ